MSRVKNRQQIMELMGQEPVDDYSIDRGNRMVDEPMPSKSITPTSSGQQVQANTQQTGQMKQAGGAMMSTGNPYLMAGGLALQTIGGAKERELQREAQAINNEISRRDKVMQMMSQLGSGFGRLG